MRALLRRLLHVRLAISLALLAALAIVLLNEASYKSGIQTLARAGLLADARLASARCLQLLTDAETAQRGYLLTGRDDYLAPYEAARRELPEVLEPTLAYLAGGGPANAAAAEQVRALIGDKLGDMGLTISLAQTGKRDAAMSVVTSDIGELGMKKIREAFALALKRSADQQTSVRASVYGSLLADRVAIAALTVIAVFVLYLFLRQKEAVAAERERHEAQLDAQVRARTADLRELASHLQAAREAERRALARELHEGLGSLLAVARLELLRLKEAGLPSPAAVEALERRLDEAVALERRLAEALHPSALDTLGLKAALSTLCQATAESLGTPIAEEIEDVELPPAAALTIYRLVQEALVNIGKYAQASAVRVRLQASGEPDGGAVVEVHDNGQGFDVTAVRVAQSDLAALRFRVEAHGGRLAVDSRPGGGTTLQASLP